jgi:hypothetical protein
MIKMMFRKFGPIEILGDNATRSLANSRARRLYV